MTDTKRKPIEGQKALRYPANDPENGPAEPHTYKDGKWVRDVELSSTP